MAPVENGNAAFGDALAVFYGSQTGTAEEVAWDLVREGRAKGFCCSEPRAMNDIDVQSLCRLRFVVFVVSTTGQGEPPVNMKRLWQDLLVASLPKTLLEGMRFAVFGLGDRHYREFNYAARKLHARLHGLGAEPFLRLGLGDDQHDFGLEQELDPWAEAMWDALTTICQPRTLSTAEIANMNDCRYSLEIVGQASTPSAFSANRPTLQDAEEFVARVRANWSLCTQEHAKEQQEVRNICLQLPPSRSYSAGDVLVVWPQADSELVTRFVVETLGLELTTLVKVSVLCSESSGGASSSAFPETPLTLEDIFTSYLDISAVPSRHFFHVLSKHTTQELHNRKLSEFASRTLEGKDSLYEYCKREKRSAAEVMWDFWTARPPLAELLSALPPMRPRRYSIASCPQWCGASVSFEGLARHWASYTRAVCPAWRLPLAGAGAIGVCAEALQRQHRQDSVPTDEQGMLDLCVAIVQFTTRTGREGKGLCSTFLQRAEIGDPIRCSFEKGTLAPRPANVPLILVCPGTGLSPCRALVQDRHLELSRSGAMKGGRFQAGLKDLMFLGFRHREGDFLYGDEWSTFEPWLSVRIAFSRDHEDRKVYVQDVIEENGAHVCGLLDAGAQIFVCGRAHPMPAQVFDAFVEVLQVHRGLTLESATNRLREMQRTQQYICDTWG
mmetsp:Transcript_82433/g.266990  ORF Transcript_82433/g.266990 Transcript_82433/m.266990 type:complete len:669 (-) Transcript_82433:170-2176(-)|eukprot:CAMPEP_0203917742 /NCGR_PEP_ID=MMETSP0359-20131031/58322_1 /ASSEMBLY_ACC=CAM_ASM_000338 /TAXON_ID=268821 /ORGANISM="Scrippsiella Hangoei, Strain SHTV-5" /LENGTH=668 /DNA_ID=CAMNT_0050844697 /DNA_START=50 /DNA_END=2056 /DNA_ORIENTATION=+